ncbi:DUF998 domain-containing protein [Pseudomonas fulva]|jgi:Protein of unknown function (DUF998)|uniref:DUF998 domain-containing protein n=1 Tax=Pseudomonas TaxID=286 RepID=UPI0019D27B9F|nr:MULTISPECIES: DUF998 domain-containing protein [Pseudomonas]MCY4126493.1 DUF998 domain-containing protein [Pseudomonas sp.]MBN6790320.1 DUF998 domain-containing protein [Pseudomonas fulva]MBN6795374.1 DUF998 domain-containing protein [Pseudomonas fulva]MBN6856034.1 DUF998 domain-containing protein [Pseudomonas fulva]MBN6873558.1 DUF998 domain-containing protein [Pseudomonas fulva]
MKLLDRALLSCGLLIPFWLALGVSLTAMAYPGYDHLQLAMSQLGAVGAPTHGLSPLVNNFPLALLFALFAWGIARRWRGSRLAMVSAVLLLLHAVGSLGTGWFACDQGCAPDQPSTSQQLHNLSGLLMFLSLTLASGLWVWLGARVADSRALAVTSLVCTLGAIITIGFMGQAMQSGELFGLYQRLNYGVGVVWVAAIAGYSLCEQASTGAKAALA